MLPEGDSLSSCSIIAEHAPLQLVPVLYAACDASSASALSRPREPAAMASPERWTTPAKVSLKLLNTYLPNHY